jgi:histidine ammonia-lyase
VPKDALILTGNDLTIEDVIAVARHARRVALAPEAIGRMAAGRRVVEDHLAAGKAVYGLTTGLGARVTHRLSEEELADFSTLTIRGRSNSVGDRLPREAVRAVVLLRLNGLLQGGAGASPAVAEAMEATLNAGLHPVIPSIGSIGAGDLCVLAHLGLALIGEGEMEFEGETLPAAQALERAGLQPLVVGPKDGLSICNASSYSAGLAALVLADARELLEIANVAAALSMEGFRANLSPLDPRAVAARPAPGQIEVAAQIRRLLEGSALSQPGAARRLQDPISLRCVAQLHGSLAAAIAFVEPALMAEINGTCDNPLVLIDDEEIISTGNFHTGALTLGLETLGQALSHVAGVSLSRAGRLLLPRLSDLPANLTRHDAARSGFTPLMKTGEALLQEIRHAALPAPRELRWASDWVEDDHANTPLAARKTATIIDRMRLLLAIELLVAAQAVELAEVTQLGAGPAAAQRTLRALVPFLVDDRPLGRDVEAVSCELLSEGQLLAAVRAATMG